MQKKLEIRIIRCNRKTVAMKVEGSGSLIMRVPEAIPSPEIDAFIKKHWDWITHHLQLAEEREARTAVISKFSPQEIDALADRALQIIPKRVAYFASAMGVKYGCITIRNQRMRWGSCSSMRNLNFNCLLMLVPEKTRDYVIVHELAHLKEMNHSSRFWAEVGKWIPDHSVHRKWLKEHQADLIGRL